MTEVRIRHKLTGHEYNQAAAIAAADPNVTVIDKPTRDEHGNEIPPKHRADLAPENDKKKES